MKIEPLAELIKVSSMRFRKEVTTTNAQTGKQMKPFIPAPPTWIMPLILFAAIIVMILTAAKIEAYFELQEVHDAINARD